MVLGLFYDTITALADRLLETCIVLETRIALETCIVLVKRGILGKDRYCPSTRSSPYLPHLVLFVSPNSIDLDPQHPSS